MTRCSFAWDLCGAALSEVQRLRSADAGQVQQLHAANVDLVCSNQSLEARGWQPTAAGGAAAAPHRCAAAAGARADCTEQAAGTSAAADLSSSSGISQHPAAGPSRSR